MFKRILTAALLAGGLAGLVGVFLHFTFMQDVILLAEQYEEGELVHFASGSAADDAVVLEEAEAAAGLPAGHDHAAAAGVDEESPLTRNGLTVVFWVLVYAGFGLLVTAGFALSEAAGRRVDASTGLLWGIAGFAAFQAAPALGLPPEVPGSIAADITLRQIWWWSTVTATAGGLALLAFVRNVAVGVVAVALMLAPHVIGAPEIEGFWGVVPPELAAIFAARVLGVGLVCWAVLGWTAGTLWSRGAGTA